MHVIFRLCHDFAFISCPSCWLVVKVGCTETYITSSIDSLLCNS
ncbi:LOW QUALITY PROTEIN: uncharacterized protein LOC110228182 [Arabidopsis lyrata subsp. lyrata]|nr:LOW QUALITY PROTEIN: uncharacterized protein LOC110228182 [Arabidopsis lyrata subsp. lyrata]|eukprot:XP_020880410.1 LOW QUALITY PROTEIN: uncharacterized protein LOC110228182 [Arabidopsis lyrata subsp. lyrata]